MPLYDTWTVLNEELEILETEIRNFTATSNASTTHAFTLKDELYLEGHLSRLWQAWGKFCRSLIIKSCMGTIDGNGSLITRVAGAISEEHVSAAAMHANQKNTPPPNWTKTNGILRKEPTWGDIDVLTKITSNLIPSNAVQINAAISTIYTTAKDIQTIRNATAHTNNQTTLEVRGIMTRYVVFPTNHPIQATLWTVHSTSDFLIANAIEELKMASLSAIS